MGASNQGACSSAMTVLGAGRADRLNHGAASSAPVAVAARDRKLRRLRLAWFATGGPGSRWDEAPANRPSILFIQGDCRLRVPPMNQGVPVRKSLSVRPALAGVAERSCKAISSRGHAAVSSFPRALVGGCETPGLADRDAGRHRASLANGCGGVRARCWPLRWWASIDGGNAGVPHAAQLEAKGGAVRDRVPIVEGDGGVSRGGSACGDSAVQLPATKCHEPSGQSPLSGRA